MILYHWERADSPFVYIRYADAEGKIRNLKTAVRKSDPEKVQKVAVAINKVEAQLLNRGAKASGGGWQWVPGWLGTKYAAKPLTLQTYRAHWKWLALYLRESELNSPAAVEREDCFAYVEWRRAPVKEKSRRQVGLNKALDELKLLGMLIDEAIVRGIAVSNPARKLGIEREDTREKPEMTDAEIGKILDALKDRPRWMFRSFFMALQTGLRFSETALRRAQVQRGRDEIVIEKPKGGRERAFAIPIYPEIKPMIDGWLATREPALWSLPPAERDFASLVWTKFFRELGLPHLCFHCTRVTFISRGARAGVPESMMMKLVNHASREVHRIYQRLADADARRYRAQIAIPTGVGAKF